MRSTKKKPGLCPRPFIFRWWGALIVLWIFAGGSMSAQVRAAEVDGPLRVLANDILEYGKEHNWENIGVLNFRVKVGKNDESWFIGRLSSTMAIRMENVLILESADNSTIGITRGAGQTAVDKFKNLEIDYTKPEGRKKLFEIPYPLAWQVEGDGGIKRKEGKVSAFITGLVEVSQDFRTMVVNLEVIESKKNGDTEIRSLPIPMDDAPHVLMKYKADPNVAKFTVNIDPAILDEMEVPFGVKARKTDLTPDLQVPPPPPIIKPNNTANNPPSLPVDTFLEFQIKYVSPNGFVRDTKKTSANNSGTNLVKIQSPNEKEKVIFHLKNIHPKGEKIAVVILVNGINTIGEEKNRHPREYSRWILSPNIKYVVNGFYKEEQKKDKLKEFQVTNEKQARKFLQDQTKNIGKISVYVFQAGKPEDKVYAIPSTQTMAAKLTDLKTILMTAPPKAKGVIVPGNVKWSKLQRGSITNPHLVAYETIVYFSKGN